MTSDVPTHQLALAMFSDFGINDVKISESPADFGFQKADALIAISDLSLVSRRAINALHFIASENPKKGLWDVDLGYFKWLANFSGSRNDKHLKTALRESQQAAIQVSVIDAVDSSKDVYASVPMLGTFVMSGGRLSFKLPDEISRLLQAPTDAKYLSLRIGGSFTSAYAYGLYEQMLRYRDAGETAWIPVEEVKNWFQATAKKSLQEYKVFKRDVLKVGLEQIKQVSDLVVTLEERREQRRVTMLKFIVRPNPDFAVRHSPPLETEMQAIYQTLSEDFGLSTKDFDEIMAKREIYTNRRIEQVIELVRFRSQRMAIRRPASYFMKMLREGVVLSATEKQGTQTVEDQETKAAKAKEAADRRKAAAPAGKDETLQRGAQAWALLSPEERLEVWNKYVRSLPGKMALKTAKLSADVAAEDALEHDSVSASFFAALTSPAARRKKAAPAEA